MQQSSILQAACHLCVFLASISLTATSAAYEACWMVPRGIGNLNHSADDILLKSGGSMQEEAVAVSQQREQLVLAEKLFGMDITSYPDLIQVCDLRLLEVHVGRSARSAALYILACAAP